MTIHRLIQNLSFNQDDIDRLAAAYEDALRALHISDRDDPINQIIAQRIIEGARAGVRDPHDLCKMANVADQAVDSVVAHDQSFRRVDARASPLAAPRGVPSE
jgi:hypothetical protein